MRNRDTERVRSSKPCVTLSSCTTPGAGRITEPATAGWISLTSDNRPENHDHHEVLLEY